MNEKAVIPQERIDELIAQMSNSDDFCFEGDFQDCAKILVQQEERIAALQAEVDALKAEVARLSAPVKHPFGLMDCEMREADPCKCGAGWIPRGTAGILWYWQRHSREVCTLDLPDMQCWCGLKRSEHVDGHRILARATPPQDMENGGKQ